jgi:hypothetical protein
MELPNGCEALHGLLDSRGAELTLQKPETFSPWASFL